MKNKNVGTLVSIDATNFSNKLDSLTPSKTEKKTKIVYISKVWGENMSTTIPEENKQEVPGRTNFSTFPVAVVAISDIS
jgi:hypothetical protein